MTSELPTIVAMFGLGEAGSLIARDLVAAGVQVRAFDPAPVPTSSGVSRFDDPNDAIPGVDVVMAVTAASDARTAMEQAWEMIAPPVLYADLATASPLLKGELADRAARKGVPFVDVALMAPVPGRGLATPSLASGTGSSRYAEMINEAGGSVEAIGGEAGVAAARKLMRSIVTKGLTALLIETMELASVRGDDGWLWRHLVEELTTLDEASLVRFLQGTARHAERRLHEMEAARGFLLSEAVPAPMTEGVVTALRTVVESGMPEAAARRGRDLL